MDSQNPEGYAALRQQEINGTGIASPNQVPWPVQLAAQRQQEQQAATAAATQDKALKARHAWTPPTSGGRKRGR